MYSPVNKQLVPWHDHDSCHFGGKHTGKHSGKNPLPGPSDKHLSLDLVPIPALWLQTIGPITL